ncbi:hypothetical protein PSN45_000154 [Yamadazyma tenuis]|uniref:uncharacterized protein n=1 Tax=Candida tenuis TaxID=2315449 RepID=UPI00279903EE|nr:hypothetical protein PSN45_000154 [Yamadazyma tenuis]
MLAPRAYLFWILFVWQGLLTVYVGGIVIGISDASSAALNASEYSLIYFYKPGCSACMALEPTYHSLQEYYDNTREFQLLEVDGSNSDTSQLKRQFGIQSYPSVFLYSATTQQALKYTGSRNQLGLINFINDHTPVINRDIESNIKPFDLSLPLQNDLVVLSMSYMPTFDEYEYPSHFFQQMSYDYPYNFHVLFVDQMETGDFLERYRISNYPSAIYFRTPENIKSFKTLSVNHDHGDKLGEVGAVEFVQNIDSDEYGRWFTSRAELVEYADGQQYEFVEDKRYGMHVRAHGGGDDEEDYEKMVGEMGM